MSTQALTLKRSSQDLPQDLHVPVPKKACTTSIAEMTADTKSQTIVQERLALASTTPPPSPQRVSTPLKYHTYEGVTQEKLKQLKKFKGKEAHTLASSSANTDFRLMQANYPKIRNIQRELDEAAKSVEIDGIGFEITKEEVSVLGEGKKNTFGFHDTQTSEGVKQKRAFPKSGEGMITIPGKEVFDLVQKYKKTAPKMTFEEFVANERENIPPTKTS